MPKLSKIVVDDVLPGGSDIFIWDTELKGFGLRVKPSGTKSFLVQYRNLAGQSKRVTLGRYGPLTCDQARKAAKRELARVALGNDLRAERDELRAAWTVRSLCEEYLREAEAGNVITRRGKPKTASTLSIDRGRIERHILPLLGKKVARDLTAADVRGLLAAVRAGKTATVERTEKLRGKAIVTGGAGTARKSVTLLSAILTYGVEQGIIENNVARGIRLPRDGKREVRQPAELLVALGRALKLAGKAGEPWQATEALKLLALSGMRRKEVLTLRWADIAWNDGMIRLRQAKTDTTLRPLSAPVARHLQWIRKHSGGSAEYVFPGIRNPGHPYGGLPNAVRRITASTHLNERDREALQEFHPHLLRHAAATIGNSLRLTVPTIGAILGHSGTTMTERYIGRVDGALLSAANELAGYIERLLDDDPWAQALELEEESEVIPLFDNVSAG
ncbi:MAG: integrase arm-type DNA-binding domain-containing protein [Paracoccaceae bacterium]|nr:integrase arm-type DNA-binding domain-containing protein [Paracoccaceae bacterium]